MGKGIYANGFLSSKKRAFPGQKHLTFEGYKKPTAQQGFGYYAGNSNRRFLEIFSLSALFMLISFLTREINP
jgi:hypothetical protein